MSKKVWKLFRKCFMLAFGIAMLFNIHPVYSTSYLQLQPIISTVNQETISVEKFKQQYQFSKWADALFIRTIYEQGDMDWTQIEAIYAPILNLLRDSQLYGEYLLDRMEYEIVIKQSAEQRGITVEQASIDELLQHDIDFLAMELPAEFFLKAEEEMGVEEETIRESYFYRALEQALFDDIKIEGPTEQLEFHIRHILLAFNTDNPYDNASISAQQRADALGRAENIIELLENGGSFPELALSYSDDMQSAENGGDVSWGGEDAFFPSIWEAIENAPVGSIVGPVESQFGYHVIEILERDTRPIDPQIIHQQQQEAFTKWKEEKINTAEINRCDDWQQYIPTSPTYEDLLGDIAL